VGQSDDELDALEAVALLEAADEESDDFDEESDFEESDLAGVAGVEDDCAARLSVR